MEFDVIKKGCLNLKHIDQERIDEVLKNIIDNTKNSGNQIGKAFKDFAPKLEDYLSKANFLIKVRYNNWKNEIGVRTIIPQKIWYGHTEYHSDSQWLMDVWDVEKDAQRTYAMMDIIEFIKEN